MVSSMANGIDKSHSEPIDSPNFHHLIQKMDGLFPIYHGLFRKFGWLIVSGFLIQFTVNLIFIHQFMVSIIDSPLTTDDHLMIYTN